MPMNRQMQRFSHKHMLFTINMHSRYYGSRTSALYGSLMYPVSLIGALCAYSMSCTTTEFSARCMSGVCMRYVGIVRAAGGISLGFVMS